MNSFSGAGFGLAPVCRIPGEWDGSDAGGRVAPMGPMFRASGIGAGGVGKAVTLFIGTGVVRLSKPEVIAARDARVPKSQPPESRGIVSPWDLPDPEHRERQVTKGSLKPLPLTHLADSLARLASSPSDEVSEKSYSFALLYKWVPALFVRWRFT